MKTNIVNAAIVLVGACSASVFASTTGAGGEGSGPLVWFFIGFGVMLIMLQAVPALLLFVAMVKSLFVPAEKEAPLPKM